MGLSNSAKRARSYSQTINQNQGGGEKKAGFPYQVGRSSASTVAFNMTKPRQGHCCKLSAFNTTIFPLANFSRPIGTSYSANYRKFHIVGN